MVDVLYVSIAVGTMQLKEGGLKVCRGWTHPVTGILYSCYNN